MVTAAPPAPSSHARQACRIEKYASHLTTSRRGDKVELRFSGQILFPQPCSCDFRCRPGNKMTVQCVAKRVIKTLVYLRALKCTRSGRKCHTHRLILHNLMTRERSIDHIPHCSEKLVLMPACHELNPLDSISVMTWKTTNIWLSGGRFSAGASVFCKRPSDHRSVKRMCEIWW